MNGEIVYDSLVRSTGGPSSLFLLNVFFDLKRSYLFLFLLFAQKKD